MDKKSVVIIGAGVMGKGVAQVLVQNQYHVYIYDRLPIDTIINTIQRNIYMDSMFRNKNSMDMKKDVTERLQPLETMECLSSVDIIIENITEDIQEKNIGLEEGINTYDENNIINKILSLPTNKIPENCQKLISSLKLPSSKDKYASSGYVQETLCADKLLKACKLEQTIQHDQLIGTYNCEQQYNSISNNAQNNWKNLNSKVDTSVKHTYARYNNMFNPEWYKKHKTEIINNLQDIHSMLDECSRNKNFHVLGENK